MAKESAKKADGAGTSGPKSEGPWRLRTRGGPALCFLAGVALVADHLLTGVLAMPFFGGHAFVWGNVLGAFVLALALGIGGGAPLGWLAGGPPRGSWRLVSLAGAAIVASTWAFPRVARHILDGSPDSLFAPGATFALVLSLPGACLAAAITSAIRADSGAGLSADAAVKGALRKLAFAMLGGVVGLALASIGLRHSDQAPIWARLAGLGGALGLIGGLGLGTPGRVVMGVLGAGLVSLIVVRPSEVQGPEYRAALMDVFEPYSPGRYYALTAPPHVLTGTELERRLAAARHRLQGNDKKIAILVVIETLKALGPLNISGVGLKGLFDIYLPESSKRLVLPFIDQIAGVTSDGRRLKIRILRSPDDGYAHFKIPGENDAQQEFEIRDDFELAITSSGDRDSVTKLEIGPQLIEKAGTFGINDTVRSPIVCKNVALWIDACLLAVTVENRADLVSVRASAQASIGKLQSQVLQTIDKASVK